MPSPLNYDLVTPRQIVFGWGRRTEVGRLARSLGRRAFLIVGAKPLAEQGVVAEIVDRLKAEQVEAVEAATLLHEPEVADVDRLAAELRAQHAEPGDLMLGLGGGAAIDMAKAAAAMATNHQSATVKDYLENVGRDLKIVEPPLPVLAMPTTAGTGTEATRNAVISSYDPPFKKSLRDTRIMPQIALVDPELSVSVPAAVTAASGMDAITQLLESYISRKAQPIPQALARHGLKLALPAIVEAVRNPTSRPAREAMSHAAMLSGICLANSGLGMAHGVAAALGVHCRAAHGAACALMLPVALRVNRQVRAAELADLGRDLFGLGAEVSTDEVVDRLIGHIDRLCLTVGVPRRLSDLGVRREQIPDLVVASRGSSMSGNPRELSDAELAELLEQLL
jgi:alcohol dehydrogenase class IV